MSEYLSDRQDIWYGTSLDLKTPFLMVFTDPPPFSTPTQLYHPGQTPKTRVQRPEKLKSGDRFLEWYSMFYDVFLLSRSRKSLSESFPTVSRPLWWPDGAISKIWSSHKINTRKGARALTVACWRYFSRLLLCHLSRIRAPTLSQDYHKCFS